MENKVLIIDFGSQVTQLIARRIREFNVYSEVKNPEDIKIEELRINKPKAIIFSGGPNSVYEEDAPTIDKAIFDLEVPILGICYGQQLICHLLGGKVGASSEREFGKAKIDISKDSPLLQNISNKQVWMSHGDKVEKLPEDFEVIATTQNAPFAVISSKRQKIYGVQFHPEVEHSIEGREMLKNFVINIAGCEADWTMKNFKEESIAEIKRIVGDKKVVCGLSGGVDSSVVAALINEAIGTQLTCVFVDHGLLRKGEGEQVLETFGTKFKTKLVYSNAKNMFLSRLKGISDPEEKRKRIGNTFITIFDKEIEKAKMEGVEFLAQGTLYPDVIESSHPNKGKSQTIKSHHNVGGLPEDMKLKLLEPVRMLFKDEVRALGRELGLSEEIVGRHPFPGPGLGIRILGEVTEEKIEILQKADAIYISEIRKAGLYDKIWQAFSVLLPVKTVGVMGDARTYENVLALRAVTAIDGMTAEVYHFESEFLCNVSNKIINEVKGINRVVYDYTSKPPGTIEWE